MALVSKMACPSSVSKAGTVPNGNLAKKSAETLVSPCLYCRTMQILQQKNPREHSEQEDLVKYKRARSRLVMKCKQGGTTNHITNHRLRSHHSRTYVSNNIDLGARVLGSNKDAVCAWVVWVRKEFLKRRKQRSEREWQIPKG